MTMTPASANNWDLTPLYASPDDPAWEVDLQGALRRAQDYAAELR
jgi:hypothetical protein